MREVATLRDLLDRYRVGRCPDHVQADYDHLLALGNTSRQAAVQVLSESLHRVLVILDEALPRVHAADVHLAYTQLYAATIRQLSAVQA